MKINDITVFSYDANYKHGLYSMSHGRTATGHKSIVVRIRTDNAIEGWAETAPLDSNYLPSSFTGELAALKELGPQIIGLNPLSPAVVDSVMDRAMVGAMAAKAVIDIACWDIVGRHMNLPTATLFGGILTDRPRGFSVIGIRDPDAAVSQVKTEFEKGSTAMQLKGGDDPIVDAERVKAIRAVLPDNIRLWVDANGGWTLDEALTFARVLGPGGAMGLEQPCRTLADSAEVCRRTGLPVFLDESIVTLNDLAIAHSQGVTGVNIKPSRVGGFTKARLIRDAAAAFDMMVNCDDPWGGALTAAQNMVLAVTTPSERLRAVDMLFSENIGPAIADEIQLESDGRVTPSTKPGNGYGSIRLELLGEPLFEIKGK